MIDVVITAGTALGSVLALAEALKKEINLKVYVLCTDLNACNILDSSKYVDEVRFIEVDEPLDYIVKIKEWYKVKKFDSPPVLYSTTDTTCYLIINDRQWFEQNFRLTLPSSNIIRTFTEKGLAEIAACQAGLSVPKTIVLTTPDSIEARVKEFTFPLILKPRATYLKGDVDFKLKVVVDVSQLREQATKLLVDGNTLLCQEFIPGGDEAAYYYMFYRSKSGSLYYSMGRKILQSTKDGGIMLKGQSEHNGELAEICENFLAAIGYQGIGGIEFKKHKGLYYFIEMSVRLEGFYKLAEITNVPLSIISYSDSAEISRSFPDVSSQKDGVIYIDLGSTLISHMRNKRIKCLIIDLFNSIFNPRYHLNIFSLTSPSPFIMKMKSLIENKP